MEMLFTLALVLHITAGFTALVAGFSAILSPKGKRTHLLTGRTFYYAMLLIALSAVALSLLRPNIFLLLIAFFAFYQNVNGVRSIRNKGLRPAPVDWLITATGLATGICMLWTMNLVLLVFGGLSCYLVFGDLRTYITVLRGRELSKTTWILRHIGLMMGAYIATVTAFVVVNVHNVQPAWLPWLAPTFLGVPVLIAWQRKYAAPRTQEKDAVA